MIKSIYTFVLFVLPAVLYAQCGPPSLFRNASFEDQSCCPSFLGQFDCLDHWQWPHPLASPDYHHACDFEGSLNNPPIYAYAHGYPDGMGRVNISYCDIAGSSEMIQTCTEDPLNTSEEYTFSAYFGINRATTQGVLMPTKLALYGSIGSCNVNASFAGYFCPSQSDWDLLTEISYTYDGEQGWVYGQSDCFQPTKAYNRFVIGNSCDLNLCGGAVLDLVELQTCRTLLAVDMEITPNTCLNNPTGAINLIVQGDNGPFTYDWAIDGIGDADDDEDLIGIASGAYPVTVTDAAGVSRCLDVFVPEDIGPSIPTNFSSIGPLCQNITPPALPTNSLNTPNVTGTWTPNTINTSVVGMSDYTFTPDASICAETFVLSIEILEAIGSTINYDGCSDDGYSIVVNNQTYNEANPVGQETVASSTGCDSIIDINLSFADEIPFDITHSGCENDGYSVTINNTVYNEYNPVGEERLTSSAGCDSVINVNLEYNVKKDSFVTYQGCAGDGFAITINNVEYNEQNPTGSEETTSPLCGINFFIELMYDQTIEFEESLSFIPGQDLELNIEEYLDLINANVVSISWSPSDQLSCDDCPVSIFNGNANTLYTVDMIDENGCTHFGQFNLIREEIDLNVFIPTSFSPNNDGINDEFRIFTDMNVPVLISSLDIFDRWGNLVFQRSNVSSSDELAFWDGLIDDAEANQGVYVYVLQGTDSAQQTFTRHGHVTLVR